MSSHPGSTINEAIDLALYLKKNNIRPEQVQDFYPTPSTASTTMYYTGINPFTGEEVYVPTSYEEKKIQRALLQYNKPENRDLVQKAIEKTGRYDAKELLSGSKKSQAPVGRNLNKNISSTSKTSKDRNQLKSKSDKPLHNQGNQTAKNRKGWAKSKPKATKGTKKKH